MFRPIVLLALFCLGVAPAAYGDQMLRTDANILTSLDVSRSIHQEDAAIEFEGLAEAIMQPGFLRIVQSGLQGRIGFAVLIWSSHGSFEIVVPWTTIESSADIERIANSVLGTRRSASLKRGSTAANDDEDHVWRSPPGDLTDTSRAIHISHDLVASAPFTASRSIINICANGEDNVGNGPDAARDLALADGIALNGLVIGDAPGLARYLRAHVIGGVGSFVLEAHDPASLADAFLAKFLMDLIATGPQRPQLAQVAE